MNKTLNDTTMQQIIHEKRETESWIISETPPPKETVQALIGAHLNVLDYYGNHPFIIFSIKEKPKKGQVFRDVFLLSPKAIPEEHPCILVNGKFLRDCLPHEIKDASGETLRTHSLDGLRLIFDDENYTEKIATLEKRNNLFVVGVYGNNKIHFSRGTE